MMDNKWIPTREERGFLHGFVTHRFVKNSLTFFVFVSLIGIFSGCSTYKGQSKAMANAWQAGNYDSAVAAVNLKAEKSTGSNDELLWRLEQGSVLSAVGNIEGSLRAFDRAEELVNRYEDEAKLQLGGEALALLTTQANLPYKGRAYDKIMMNSYKALNYLLLSDPDNARVELNRAFQRQKNAVIENQKKIEKSIEAAEKSKQGTLQGNDGKSAPGYDVDRAQRDARFSTAANAELAKVDQRLLSYADYVNPFSVFLEGLFFSHLGFDGSDIEHARQSFERVKGMSPGTYISADHAMAEAMANGAQAETLTYIIFATGRAPTRDQIRIDIPLFLLTDEASYVGASFPKLKYHDQYIPQMTAVSSSGTSYSSELLCSMDAIISRDFKNDWPMVVTKTLLTSATKAIAGRAAEEVAQRSGNQWAVLATRVASTAFQASSNIADLRTWITLPKEFSYIRMPTPEDGVLTLRVGANEQKVSVTPRKTNIIMVRSVNDISLPILEQFTLN